jgi:hypothetical protein
VERRRGVDEAAMQHPDAGLPINLDAVGCLPTPSSVVLREPAARRTAAVLATQGLELTLLLEQLADQKVETLLLLDELAALGGELAARVSGLFASTSLGISVRGSAVQIAMTISTTMPTTATSAVALTSAYWS